MRVSRALLVLGMSIIPVASAAAIEPPGETGKETGGRERRIIGREQGSNTFRRGGSILSQASSAPVPVNPEQLAARQRALYRGDSYTRGLPAVAPSAPAALAAPAASEQAQPRPMGDQPVAATGGLSTVHYLVFAAVLGVILLVAGRWVAGRRRMRLAAATCSAAAPRRRRAWTDRDLNITMGQRDE